MGRLMSPVSYCRRWFPQRRIVDRLLDQLSGTLWIDCQEYELARAEINLLSEVNVLGGVVGSLKRMNYLLERTRFSDGVWLNAHSRGEFQGRKLLDLMHLRVTSDCTHFHPVAYLGNSDRPSG